MRNSRNLFVTVFAAAAIVSLLSMSLAADVSVQGDVVTEEPCKGWAQEGDVWRFYDDNGDLVTGFFEYNGDTYYFDLETGDMFTGKHTIDGEEYYFHEQYGFIPMGWRNDLEKEYYYNDHGFVVLGWINDNGDIYYMDPVDGVVLTGWQEIEGKKYYFYKN